MNAVGLEQRPGRLVVALRLDALHLRKEGRHPRAERLGIDHHVVRPAVARPPIDRLGVRHQPVDDHLAVAHVVLLDLAPVAHPPELKQRVAGVGLVLGEHDVLLRLGRENADLDELRVGEEVEPDEVGPRLLEGRVLLVQPGLGRAAQPLRQLPRGVADDLVHVRGHLAGEAAPLPRALRLLLRPRELLPVAPGPGQLVGLVHVRQRDRLAAVLLAHRLVVGQVDADGRQRAGVAGLDDHVDGVGGDAGHARLAVAGVPGHPVLEPLGVLGQRPDGARLLRVDVEDQRLPRALGPAGVHVHLGEAVDGVDRRALVLDPGDVVGPLVDRRPRPVVGDVGAQRLRHGFARVGNRRLQMAHDLGDLVAVPAADLVDLLDEPAVDLHETRGQGVLLLERLQVGHGDALVEVVGARQQHVLAGTGGLVGDDGLEAGIEEQRRHPLRHLPEVLAVTQRELGPGPGRRPDRVRERGGGRLHHEPAGREAVERTGVDPEELRVLLDRGQRPAVDAAGTGDDLLEDLAHLEVVLVALVVVDVTPGQRRLIQMPDECLVAQRQRLEAVGVELHDRRVVDPLQQVAALAVLLRRHRGRGDRRCQNQRRRHPDPFLITHGTSTTAARRRVHLC